MKKKKQREKFGLLCFLWILCFFSGEKNKENKEAELNLFVFFRVGKNKGFKENKAAWLFLFVFFPHFMSRVRNVRYRSSCSVMRSPVRRLYHSALPACGVGLFYEMLFCRTTGNTTFSSRRTIIRVITRCKNDRDADRNSDLGTFLGHKSRRVFHVNTRLAQVWKKQREKVGPLCFLWILCLFSGEKKKTKKQRSGT